MKSILPLLVLISLSQCGPVTKENESLLKTVISNFVSCMNEDISLCLKENALKLTERLATTRELKITQGLTYINSEPEKSEKAEIVYSDDPEVREKQVSEKLDEHVASILDNAEIEVKVPGFGENEDDEISARGKKGKKKLKLLIPLLLLAKAKAVALMTAFLGIIAFSIFKIMVMLKIAFIAKALAILKWLLSKHHHHHEEHGWIPHEEHHEHHGWDGGWARSKSDAQNLAYAAHRK